MHIRHLIWVFIATGFAASVPAAAAAQAETTNETPPEASANVGESPPIPPDNDRVREAEVGQGLAKQRRSTRLTPGTSSWVMLSTRGFRAIGSE